MKSKLMMLIFAGAVALSASAPNAMASQANARNPRAVSVSKQAVTRKTAITKKAPSHAAVPAHTILPRAK